MKTKANKVSVKDVARLAGVSLGSVSRVINKIENVTPQVRERVEWAMAKLDYQVNHAAQMLRSRSSRTIGCMFTDVTNPLYASLYRMLEERFRESGYMVLLANSLNNPQRELEIMSTFSVRNMDGVVIAPSEYSPEVQAAVRRLHMPTVVLDRDLTPTATQDLVLFDHVTGVKNAVNHLIDLGHRDIAVVLTKTQTRPMLRRIQAYRSTMNARGCKPRSELLVRLDTATSPAAGAMRALLALPEPPTAVLALGTGILADILHELSAQRLRVPQDISVVSLGDADFARCHQPPVAKVVVDLDLASREAVRLLQERIASNADPATRKILIPSSFVEGGTCGPAPR